MAPGAGPSFRDDEYFEQMRAAGFPRRSGPDSSTRLRVVPDAGLAVELVRRFDPSAGVATLNLATLAVIHTGTDQVRVNLHPRSARISPHPSDAQAARLST